MITASTDAIINIIIITTNINTSTAVIKIIIAIHIGGTSKIISNMESPKIFKFLCNIQ